MAIDTKKVKEYIESIGSEINKKDNYFFDQFLACARVACEAAEFLCDTLSHFDADGLKEKLEQLHQIEHKGDTIKHEMTDQLIRAFITPIEREDILALSQNIDDVTDTVEDVLIHIYINNITEIREDALEFANIVKQCCEEMCTLLTELPDFKKSKTLDKLVVALNHLEGEGDMMYVSAMRRLHVESKDPIEIIVWREIYKYLEKCCDKCENVADVVSGIAIDNT